MDAKTAAIDARIAELKAEIGELHRRIELECAESKRTVGHLKKFLPNAVTDEDKEIAIAFEHRGVGPTPIELLDTLADEHCNGHFETLAPEAKVVALTDRAAKLRIHLDKLKMLSASLMAHLHRLLPPTTDEDEELIAQAWANFGQQRPLPELLRDLVGHR